MQLKFNPVPGIIYDSIVYNIFYFCKDAFYKNVRKYVENNQDVFFNYDKFCSLKTLPIPDETFYQFFYIDGTKPCVLSKCFANYYDHFNGTYENFLHILKDKKHLKRVLVYYFLEQYREEIDLEKVIEGNPLAVTEAVVLLRSHGSYMKVFAYLFHEFDSVVDELIEYFKNLFSVLVRFHTKHKTEVKEAINQFLSSNVVDIYVKSVGIEKNVKMDEQSYSVTLLHPTVIICWYRKNDYFFILAAGAYKSVPIPSIIYNNITNNSLIKVFSNDMIIKRLAKGDLTISKLSQQLHISRTTVDRLVNELHNEFAVYVSRSVGKEKYYKFNPEFFFVAKDKFDFMFDDLMSRWKNESK